MYIHFEPTGHSLRHYGQNPESDVDSQYKQASESGVGGQSAASTGLPPYINPESPEEAHWRKYHPEGWGAVSVVVFTNVCVFLLLLLRHIYIAWSLICLRFPYFFSTTIALEFGRTQNPSSRFSG